MGLMNVFELSGSALNAQSIRLNTVARNMANADVVAGTEAEAYRAVEPVFTSTLDEARGAAEVRVTDMVQSKGQIPREYMPEHPMADADGFIYRSNVNMVEEMGDMMSATRSYQANIEVLNTSKQLMLRLLSIGR